MKGKDDRRPAVKNGDLASGTVLLALGLYLAYEALKMSFGSITRPGPGFFPTALAGLLVAAASFVLLRSLRPSAERLQVDFGGRTSHILVTVLAISLYALALEAVGFLLCTFVLVLGLLVGLGRVGWPRSLLVSGGGTIVLYLVFTQLGIPLPQGLLVLE